LPQAAPRRRGARLVIKKEDNQMKNPINHSITESKLKQVIWNAILEFQPVFDTGVAVAIVKNDKVYCAHGFGFRDRESFAKVNPNTIFQIGSNTKAFTSMLISMIAEDGKIALDCPIRGYMPDFRMKDKEASADLTLEQILSHRTGLPRHDAIWYLGPFSRAQLLYRAGYLDPIPNAYGKQFLYNNIMYMVAGYVLECLLGKGWEELVRTRILDPVGMLRTTFTIRKLVSTDNFAKAYERDAKLKIKDFSNIGPAAEMNSNVIDMANWILLFLNKGVTKNGTQIIANLYLQQMCAHHVKVGKGLSYGMGWYISKIQGKRFVFHPGDPDGYVSHVSFMPDDGLGVVVLTNQQCTADLVGIWPDKVVGRIYDYLLSPSVTTNISLPAVLVRNAPVAVLREAASAQIRDARVAAGLGGYTGIYSNDGYGDIVITSRATTLYVEYYDSEWPVVQVSDADMYFDVHAFGADFPVPIWFSGTSDDGKFAELSIPCMPFDPQASLISFARRALNPIR
jgi:CubicO group peptidase (beta-lactamase class C family)